jgi:hypothetical protein
MLEKRAHIYLTDCLGCRERLQARIILAADVVPPGRPKYPHACTASGTQDVQLAWVYVGHESA